MQIWNRLYCIIILLSIYSCDSKRHSPPTNTDVQNPHVVVLGIAQDAGYPQANCKKSCCTEVWNDLEKREKVSCIGLKVPKTNQSWLFDATPDFKDQLQSVQSSNFNLEGIFLTHGHIGHYTGLLQLGREAMGAQEVKTYVMPRMAAFLEQNGPWSQLVDLKNIKLEVMESGKRINLSDNLFVTPLKVPHRDEFTETVGYLIEGKNKSLLFIPDIDKWHKWDTDILKLVQEVDFALLDGSFFRNGEIRGRDMSLIPHPFVEESMKLFDQLDAQDQGKIHFIHLNHTNPLLNHESEAYQLLESLPYSVCHEDQIFEL